MTAESARLRLHRMGWWLAPPRCPLCGRPVLPRQLCADCAPLLKRLELGQRPSPPEGVDRLYCGWRYRDPVQAAILRMKFGHRPALGENLVLALFSRQDFYTFAAEFDIIIPIPSTAKERRGRGYDVPRLLGRGIWAACGLPLAPADTLQKIRETRRQVDLDGEQRRTNLRGAYGVQRAQLVEGKAVLLVDDVTTTGSTLAEAARALRQAGARYVGAVTLATA